MRLLAGQDIECEPQQSSHVSASPSLPLSLSLSLSKDNFHLF